MNYYEFLQSSRWGQAPFPALCARHCAFISFTWFSWFLLHDSLPWSSLLIHSLINTLLNSEGIHYTSLNFWAAILSLMFCPTDSNCSSLPGLLAPSPQLRKSAGLGTVACKFSPVMGLTSFLTLRHHWDLPNFNMNWCSYFPWQWKNITIL